MPVIEALTANKRDAVRSAEWCWYGSGRAAGACHILLRRRIDRLRSGFVASGTIRYYAVLCGCWSVRDGVAGCGGRYVVAGE